MIGTKIAVLALFAGGAGVLGLGAWQTYAHGGFRGHGRHEMVQRFIDFAVNEKLDEIGATAAQKERVRAIKDRLVEKGKVLHGDREAFRQELLALLEQDNPDPAQVKALARERIEKLSRLADEAADALVELHGVFTPEQRQKLLADVREHMERRHRGWGPARPGL